MKLVNTMGESPLLKVFGGMNASSQLMQTSSVFSEQLNFPELDGGAYESQDVPLLKKLSHAIGPYRYLPSKFARASKVISNYFRPAKEKKRIEKLVDAGILDGDKIPSYWQQMLHSAMFLFGYMSPDYSIMCKEKGINPSIQNTLRFLMAPDTMLDPKGTLSPKESVFIHILQVEHQEPVYDLQLLYQFGEDEIVLEFKELVECMLKIQDSLEQGEEITEFSPIEVKIYKYLSATVEDKNYYKRLYDYIPEFLANDRMPIYFPERYRPYIDTSGRDMVRVYLDLRASFSYAHDHIPNQFLSGLLYVAKEVRNLRAQVIAHEAELFKS